MFCVSLFSEAEEFWAGVTPREAAWRLLRESVRGLKPYGRSGGGGVNSFGLILSDFHSECANIPVLR